MSNSLECDNNVEDKQKPKNNDTKICQFCGNQVLKTTKKCEYCNSNLLAEMSEKKVVVKKKSNLFKCPSCDKEISIFAKSCPNCGHPIETTSSNKSIGYVVVIFGSLLTAIGLFLPWVQLGFFSASAFKKIDISFYLLISSALVILFASLSILKIRTFGFSIVIITGINGILLKYIYNLLTQHISEIGDIEILGSGNLGTGFWVSVFGVLIAFIGSLFLAEKKKKDGNTC